MSRDELESMLAAMHADLQEVKETVKHLRRQSREDTRALLTVRQAAQRLTIDHMELRELIDDGVVHAARLGSLRSGKKRLRVSVAEVERIARHGLDLRKRTKTERVAELPPKNVGAAIRAMKV